jgi:hypothetical protein
MPSRVIFSNLRRNSFRVAGFSSKVTVELST